MAFGFGFGMPRSFAVPPFSPASLFVGGIPGVWYDPSDYSTLFQDSAGTTPVTAVEQPVGLMLDKSQGLVLGSELVTNGDFSGGTTTGWTAFSSASLSVVAGRLRVTNNGAAYGYASQQVSVTVGRTYKFLVANEFNGTALSSVRLGTTQAGTQIIGTTGLPADGVLFTATTTSVWITLYCFSATTTGVYAEYDNIGLAEVSPNHAFQATSASRPVLSARYNLLTKTEDFSNAAWSKTGVTLGSLVTAPDGTTTAQSITYTSGGGISNFQYFNAAPIGVTPFGSIWIRSSAPLTMTLGFFDGGAFDAPVSVTSTWTLFTYAKATAFSSADRRFWLYPTNAGSNITVEIWHPQVVPTNQSSIPYQRVNTATDYDTTGFLPYLKFDGVDDSLSTNSISFTSTDKMSVFAGVRKLSDAAIAVLYELSSNFGANDGTFCMFAPNPAAGNYGFRSRGTLTAAVNITSGVSAPVTNSVTGLADIAATSMTIRNNGVVIEASTLANQGTGNYGNYPLFIGRRGGSSLPFNGQIYSMVIVGKAVNSVELTVTETYVNQQTGAY